MAFAESIDTPPQRERAGARGRTLQAPDFAQALRDEERYSVL
jgi:hypothetical protein